MRMTSGAKAYVDAAAVAGFKIVDVARGRHFRATFETPGGATIRATVPVSPSDWRGPRRFVQTLRKIARDAR